MVPALSAGAPRLARMMASDDDLSAAGLRVQQDGPVLTVVLDRPARRNAQTPAMWRALAAVGAAVPDDVRVVVVRGEGPTFSAGLDRSLMRPGDAPAGVEAVGDLFALDDAAMSARIADYQAGFTWLADPRFVSVAAVRGHAVGAGFQLALACDLRVAAPDASFVMKESALGLVPDLAGTRPLVEAVGYARALEICVTARPVGAEEALRIGLVQVLAADGDLDAALEPLLGALTAPAPEVVAETKALLLGAEQRAARRPAPTRARGPGATLPGARRIRRPRVSSCVLRTSLSRNNPRPGGVTAPVAPRCDVRRPSERGT